MIVLWFVLFPNQSSTNSSAGWFGKLATRKSMGKIHALSPVLMAVLRLFIWGHTPFLDTWSVWSKHMGSFDPTTPWILGGGAVGNLWRSLSRDHWLVFSKLFQFFILKYRGSPTVTYCNNGFWWISRHNIRHDWAIRVLLDMYYGHPHVLYGDIRRGAPRFQHAVYGCISTQTNNIARSITYQQINR